MKNMSKIAPKNIAEAIYETTIDKSGVLLAETLRRGVKLIHNKRMLGKSDEILKALQNISDKKTGTIRMKVTTANNLRPEEKKRIENEVKEKYKGKSIVSEFFEKEELLGGMRVEVGDEEVGVIILGDIKKIKEGDEGKCNEKFLEIPVSDSILGRVVNAIGGAID